MADLAFLLRPRWLLSHLFVVALVIGMIMAGFWQLDRLDQRRERNDQIRQRQSEAVVPVQDILTPTDDSDTLDDVRFRPVEAVGTYDDEATVLVRNRTSEGSPGVWVLTPLELDSGDRVGIIRGFMGLGTAGDPTPPEPPAGQVTVTGPALNPSGFDGTAPQDIDPLVEQADVLPGVVLGTGSNPADEGWGETLHPVSLPDLEEGPHLAYAGQWFIFAAIGTIGYPLTLRTIVQRRASQARSNSTATESSTNSDPDPDPNPEAEAEAQKSTVL